ncbi:MAG: lysostaphin resistance A-like protein [Planctomycetota bacterium]|jgi:membrane protease YdiL (CAAX protease family)
MMLDAPQPVPSETVTPIDSFAGFSTMETLVRIDHIITLASLVIAMALAVRFLVPPRTDPLLGSPWRGNKLEGQTISLIVAIFLLTSILISSITTTLGLPDDHTISMILIGNGSQIVASMACLVVATACFRGRLRRFILGPPRALRPANLAMTFGFFILAAGWCPIILAGTAEIIWKLSPDLPLPIHPTINALDEPTQSLATTWGLWLGAGLIAPIAEEIFFRGILQSFLVRHFHDRWRGVMVASVVFGLVHMAVPHSMPALFLMGVILGTLYEKTGSLIAPIAIHAAFNIKTLVWDYLLAA